MWLPQAAQYSFAASIPLLTVIKISSSFQRDLRNLLPVLPWTATATSWDGKQGPIAHLNVALESHIEAQMESVPFGEHRWRPSYEDTFPDGRLNRHWSEPTKSQTGRWEQFAMVSHRIDGCTRKEDKQIEPHINLFLLQSRFRLQLKHFVGGHEVNAVLSTAPWTSGIFRDSSVEISNRSRNDTSSLHIVQDIENLGRGSPDSMVSATSPPAYEALPPLPALE